MSPDAQRLELEFIRNKLSSWQIEQPDFNHRLRLAARAWLTPAMRALGMTEGELVTNIGRAPNTDALRNLLSDEAFGLEYNDETMFDDYTRGPGSSDNGLCYRYLRRLRDVEPSLWRVTRVKPGSSLCLEPWSGGRQLTIHDRTTSIDLEAGDLLLCRLIDMPAGPTLGDAVFKFRGFPPHAVTDSRIGITELLSYCVIELLESPARPAPGADTGTQADDRRDPHTGTDNGGDSVGGGGRGGAGTGSDTGSRPHRSSGERPPASAERERLLDRVRKLFAMAQQTDASPHEAEIALRRCQSLMAKYGISEADLETSAFGNAEFTRGRTVPMHVKYLAAAVAKLHDVLFVTGGGGFAEFRGYEVDANVARLTLDYLLDAIERALASRKRAGDFPAGRSAAYDYRMGFATEVSRRINELVSERNREQQQAAGTGTALAVRKREIVERECGRDLASSSFRGRGARDATARAAGTDDGARVSLDQQVASTAGREALSEH